MLKECTYHYVKQRYCLKKYIICEMTPGLLATYSHIHIQIILPRNLSEPPWKNSKIGFFQGGSERFLGKKIIFWIWISVANNPGVWNAYSIEVKLVHSSLKFSYQWFVIMPDDIRDKSQGKSELYQNISLHSSLKFSYQWFVIMPDDIRDKSQGRSELSTWLWEA